LLRPLDVRLGDDAVRQQAFDAADKHRIFVSLHERPRDARRADHRDLAVAGENGRDRRRARGNKNYRNIQIIFLE